MRMLWLLILPGSQSNFLINVTSGESTTVQLHLAGVNDHEFFLIYIRICMTD